MADEAQLELLLTGIREWNAWRRTSPDIVPDLSEARIVQEDLCQWHAEGVDGPLIADLSRANLRAANFTGSNVQYVNFAGADLTDAIIACGLERANLAGANLTRAYLRKSSLNGANLTGANLTQADLAHALLCKREGSMISYTRQGDEDVKGWDEERFFSDYSTAILCGADLTGADLTGADLTGANLTHANVTGAKLCGANLTRVDLSHAILKDADLTRATLVGTNLDGTTLAGCRVYGISAWDLDLTSIGEQTNLVITPPEEAAVTVDNLEVAQFVYLLLKNKKVRSAIDTICRKAVLILGRFTTERKAVLEALKARIRQADYVPIVFDWDKPKARDLTETVQLLATLSRFVIADITDAKSIPQELGTIVSGLPSVPICPVILQGQDEYAMFEHWARYSWVLPLYRYRNTAELVDNINSWLLEPLARWESGTDSASRMMEIIRAQEAEITSLRANLHA